MAMNGTIFKSLPYDPAKDLVPVALVAAVPFVLVVNTDAAGAAASPIWSSSRRRSR